jgi:two-component system, OmpR family, sensor histidine kinase KdpD
VHNSIKYTKVTQHIISLLAILLSAAACFFVKEIIGYKIVAFVLLMAVSILAMLFDILPVLIAAVLSALIWNFFFIPPIFTFHIDNTEDLLMFSLYFIVALVNAVLTFKIRKAEKKARDKEEKENTIKLYNTLLNSLSHELRTPIATILSAVDTLKENSKKLSITNQIELLNQIDIASIRLNTQVENLLNMSRLETGLLKINLQWCDINELINLIIQKIKLTQSKKIIFIENDTLPICKVDSGLMEQALQNIISNAMLYTPLNSIISIDVGINENNLNIHIADNGNGIAEKYIHQIFEKFYRLPNSKTGGTGLGLSIVKGFIEAHKGTIEAKNILPTGLLFTINIPVETSYINNLKNE